MRKLLVVLLILFISIGCICCSNSISGKKENAETQLPEIIENTSELCIAPVKFSSEEDFIKGLKDGRVYSQYHPEEIKYYYRPKTLPEGASLLFVEANYDYVVLMYTLDKENPEDISKQLMYKTFRGYSVEYYIGFLEESGETEYTLEGKTTDTRYFSFDSYESAKENYMSSENEGKNIGQDISSTPAWTMNFIQNGDCFSANVPYSIDEKDITKYFDMEKVIIE